MQDSLIESVFRQPFSVENLLAIFSTFAPYIEILNDRKIQTAALIGQCHFKKLLFLSIFLMFSMNQFFGQKFF